MERDQRDTEATELPGLQGSARGEQTSPAVLWCEARCTWLKATVLRVKSSTALRARKAKIGGLVTKTQGAPCEKEAGNSCDTAATGLGSLTAVC